MIFYLTFSEAPSGIFSSQVIDVVKFINQEFSVKVRLVAFISLRDYFKSRKSIMAEMPGAIVLPMVPKMSNWRANRFLLWLLCFIYKPGGIIARSVLATQLALSMKKSRMCKKVIYDGRGAIAAEWKEYNVVAENTLTEKIEVLERSAIHESDFRLAISQALIDYWKAKYNYHDTSHVIIPCTLTNHFSDQRLSQSAISKARHELSLDAGDTVFVYSGSVAGWQSFELLFSFIEPVLKNSKNNKIVFFSQPDAGIERLKQLFPGQVLCRHLKPSQVSAYLIAGDYGLLIREESVTNLVASPVKYAEYLSCGLKVILSQHLGDYTALSLKENFGYVYTAFKANEPAPSFAEKKNISEKGISLFSKKNYREAYAVLSNQASTS